MKKENEERRRKYKIPTVVDKLGVLDGQHITHAHDLTIDGQRLQIEVRMIEKRSTGCLIAAPALHTDKPVLDDIDAPDAMLASDLVEVFEQSEGICFLASFVGCSKIL